MQIQGKVKTVTPVYGAWGSRIVQLILAELEDGSYQITQWQPQMSAKTLQELQRVYSFEFDLEAASAKAHQNLESEIAAKQQELRDLEEAQRLMRGDEA